MFEHILTTVGDAVGSWTYVIAGFLVFAEAALLVGFVLPGETALLVAGAFCHYGKLHLSIMIVVAVVCAVLLAGVAVLAAVSLRHVPAVGAEPERELAPV